MKLSIVVTVYNSEKVIEKCLESIASQTYKDYEIIIINDGSTDNSEKIIKDFFGVHKEIDYKLYTGENVGANLAKQKGIKKSNGEYIGFVDSDDYIDNDFYDTLMEGTNKDVDIVCCDYILEGKGEIQRHTDRGLLNLKYIDTRQSKIAVLNHKGVYPYLWNKVIKRTLFDNIEYENKRFICEDFIIVMQLLEKAKKICLVDYNGYHYVMTKTSQTKAGYSILHKNMYKILSKFYEVNKNDDKEFTNSLQRYLILHYMSVLVNLARANKNDEEMEAEIIKFVKQHYNDYIRNSNDGIKAKIAVLLTCFNYPMFRMIANKM